jgi:hypothetical protein
MYRFLTFSVLAATALGTMALLNNALACEAGERQCQGGQVFECWCRGGYGQGFDCAWVDTGRRCVSKSSFSNPLTQQHRISPIPAIRRDNSSAGVARSTGADY